MAVLQKAKKTKKQRKHGRNKKAQNVLYVASHRRERNKLHRLTKHLARFNDDRCAQDAEKACKVVLGLR